MNLLEMTLDVDIAEIKKNQCQIYNKIPGIGLYLGVWVAAFAGIQSCDYNETILNELENMPHVKVQNTMGDERFEKFYEIDGQRAYIEIDEMSIREYVKDRF
jgi:hypothetical protein